tara:strand:- start:3868 stop:5526 length:1659 start_codon:yes stop_codon:yes gene_type:complete
MTKPSTAIYYQSDSYSISQKKLMGRNAAGESFIRAYFKYDKSPNLCVYPISSIDLESFKTKAKEFDRKESIEIISKNSLNKLANIGNLFIPGPGLDKFAYERSFSGHNSWSLCGITHTTSSSNAMDCLSSLVTAPIQDWDALICTSNSVKNHVIETINSQAEYLKNRLGISKLVLPQLPVIPLGIHTSDFSFSCSQKSSSRKTLNIDDNSIVVLYTGRLSFHAKAHPLAMYQALELASKESDKPIVLIECGWHANQSIQVAFADAADKFCPSIKVINLDGRTSQNRSLAWSSADIFCSLPDNIQETFGIVPIEAMAAGLPVVVSDWDGYKDTVRDGIDGFRIPTLIPGPGLGADLAQRYSLEIDTYDMYCGYTSSLISVDVLSAARAFIKLIQSPSLRESMGTSGLRRAKEIYDWSVIYKKYDDLWKHLHEIRTNTTKKEVNSKCWPGRVNPFKGFSSYATNQLSLSSKLSLVDDDFQSTFDRYILINDLKMISFASYILPTHEEVKCIFKNLINGPLSASDLISPFEVNRRPYILRILVWLVKLNFLKLDK